MENPIQMKEQNCEKKYERFMNHKIGTLEAQSGKVNKHENEKSLKNSGSKHTGVAFDDDGVNGIRRQDDDLESPVDFSNSDRTCIEINHENHKLCKYTASNFDFRLYADIIMI